MNYNFIVNEAPTNSDSILPFSGSILGYGAAGVAGLAVASRLAYPIEQTLYEKSAGIRNRYANKGWSAPGGSGPRKLPGNGDVFKMLKEQGASYIPGRRAANAFDRSVHEAWPLSIRRNKLNKTGKVGKTSFAGILGLSFATDTMRETGNISGLAIGFANEALAGVGAGLGKGIGSALGRGLGGKFVFSKMIGGGIGMMAGAMIGYMGIGMLQDMSKKGRRWALPELGGNFVDTKESATMRQRSLNAIRTSQFNVRNELGQEAYRLATGY